MKEEQTLKLTQIDLEPHNMWIYVEYKLSGILKYEYIEYESFIAFLERNPLSVGLKAEGTNVYLTEFDNDDISRISIDVLENKIAEYLWKKLNIDLLIENHDLKERLKKANKVIQIISDILRIRK